MNVCKVPNWASRCPHGVWCTFLYRWEFPVRFSGVARWKSTQFFDRSGLRHVCLLCCVVCYAAEWTLYALPMDTCMLLMIIETVRNKEYMKRRSESGSSLFH